MVSKTNFQKNVNIIFQSSNPTADIDAVKKIWLLIQEGGHHSFFVSWGWVSTWINSLPKNLDLRLVTGYLNNNPVAAFFIGSNKRNAHKFLPTKTISLNSTSIRYYDELTIEYNSVLFGAENPIKMDKIIEYLSSLDWDEFRLPGISENFMSTLQSTNIRAHNLYMIVDDTKNSYFVDLQRIRDANMNYLQFLSANKRSQIRRSIKQFELGGKIIINEAKSSEEALEMLDRLASLHQLEWTKRGKPGSFSNQYFYQFHKELIKKLFNNNEIQLLHIFTDEGTIGYLYNFVYDGNVLFYQSGLKYSAENAYRPGLVSHYHAILHNAKKNLSSYDFLAGDSAYKNSLSTNSKTIYWVRLFKSFNRYNFEKSVAFTQKWLLKRRNKKE